MFLAVFVGNGKMFLAVLVVKRKMFRAYFTEMWFQDVMENNIERYGTFLGIRVHLEEVIQDEFAIKVCSQCLHHRCKGVPARAVF